MKDPIGSLIKISDDPNEVASMYTSNVDIMCEEYGSPLASKIKKENLK